MDYIVNGIFLQGETYKLPSELCATYTYIFRRLAAKIVTLKMIKDSFLLKILLFDEWQNSTNQANSILFKTN